MATGLLRRAGQVTAGRQSSAATYRFAIIPSFALLITSALFGASVAVAPSSARAQSAPGGMCLEIRADGKGFQNTCPYRVTFEYCLVEPAYPRRVEGKFRYGQPDCSKKEYTGTSLRANATFREGPRSLFFGSGVVWVECRHTDGLITSHMRATLVLKPRPHFEGYCLRVSDGMKDTLFAASGQVPK